jgi:hypothetical protein
MKKLKLNVENLAVESFEANTARAKSRGTVHGASAPSVTCTVVLFTDLLSCWDWSCCDFGSCVAPPSPPD